VIFERRENITYNINGYLCESKKGSNLGCDNLVDLNEFGQQISSVNFLITKNMLTPPEQFGIIEKGVYRSDMLHPSHFSFIKALQLKTALVLSPEALTRPVTNFLEENNIKLVFFYLSTVSLSIF